MSASDTEQPITVWLEQVKQGDDYALEKIWQTYFVQLVRLARRQLGSATTTVADEDDVAQQAIVSFYLRARGGQFPDLNDRDGLWKLLISITLNKARTFARKEHRRHELWQRELAGVNFRKGEPSPEFAAEFADRFEFLLDRLNDDLLQRIAVAKLDGYTNREIAAQCTRSLPTIERKLRLIRDIWSSEFEDIENSAPIDGR